MAFILAPLPRASCRVRLKRDYITMYGTFTAGHEFDSLHDVESSAAINIRDDEGRFLANVSRVYLEIVPTPTTVALPTT